jgi:hypothetical protein
MIWEGGFGKYVKWGWKWGWAHASAVQEVGSLVVTASLRLEEACNKFILGDM